jgi:hypothetical protein
MKKRAFFFLAAVAALSFSACGSSSSNTQTFKCCVNKLGYDCSTETDFATCGKTPTSCSRNAAKDVDCK